MKRRQGSALLVVLLITAGLSMLLMRIQYRSSLLLETVYEREKQLQWYYAAQSFMLYAIHIVKQNWRYIHEQSKGSSFAYHALPWQVTEQIIGKGNMTFSSQEGGVYISVELFDAHQLKQHLSCSIYSDQPEALQEQIEKATIHNWSEKHVA